MTAAEDLDPREHALRELFELHVLSSEELSAELGADPDREKVVELSFALAAPDDDAA